MNPDFDPILGVVTPVASVSCFVVAEMNLMQGMQVFSWFCAGFAALATGCYYLHLFYLSVKKNNTDV